MSKKEKKAQNILKRAHTFFEKGNYLQALVEFEKASRFISSKEIDKKIAICQEKTIDDREQDLVKRGKKYLRNDNVRMALKCFEEAYAISKNPSIQDQINELSVGLQSIDASRNAEEAEKNGDYIKAIEYYDQAFQHANNSTWLNRKAICLVKANCFEEANALFSQIEPDDTNETLYNKGYALAITGHYYECLKVWEDISETHEAFKEQIQTVQDCLKANIFNKLRNNAPYQTLFQESIYIQSIDTEPAIDQLVEYSRFGWIAELWEKQDYETILSILPPLPEKMQPELLAFVSKLYYNLCENSGDYSSDLALYWLTSLHNRKICNALTTGNEDIDAIQNELIRKGKALLQKHADAGNSQAAQEFKYWESDKTILQFLIGIMKNRKTMGELACTPRFAVQFGRAERIHTVIKNNRKGFPSKEQFLKTGAYFTPVWKALFHIENNEFSDALTNLPEYNPSGDDFYQFGWLYVHFMHGRYNLTKGKKTTNLFAKACVEIFKLEPTYEKELSDQALDAISIETIGPYEDAFAEIYKLYSSDLVSITYSILICHKALFLYNHNKMNAKGFRAAIQKALSIDPENELAVGFAKDIRVEQDISELHQAFERMKLNKAARIAAESQYPEVQKEFFEVIDMQMREVDIRAEDDNQRYVLFNEMLRLTLSVNPSHPINIDLKNALAQL